MPAGFSPLWAGVVIWQLIAIKKARLNRDGLLKQGYFPFDLKLIDPG